MLIWSQNEQIQVPLHQVPNVGFAKIAQRHVTRLMFPHLYSPGESRKIPTTTLKRIYDQCIRPAVVDVMGEHQAHWPISYHAAFELARDRTGQLHFGSVDLPVAVLNDFCAGLLMRLDEHPDTRDAYFLHELRGTKGATVHDPLSQRDRWEVLEDFMAFLDLEAINPREWHIDVGLEVHVDHHVLQWLEVSHAELLNHALPCQYERNPRSIEQLHDHDHFKLDRVAQLNDFAGFRCTPMTRGKRDGVVYINVYTTDKSATYQLHAGMFRHRCPSELIPGNKSFMQLITDVDRMNKVFEECMGADGSPVLEGNTRFEMRMELTRAAEVLVGLPAELIENSVVAVSAELWW